MRRPNDLYLCHHGIKGMKWGVRRYQNPDGSLTSAGKKRYLSNGEKTYKRLKKEVRRQRGEVHGGANRWASLTDIGPASKKLIDEYRENTRKYESTPEYKAWNKKIDKFNRKWDNAVYDDEEYQRQWDALMDQRPKKDFTSLGGAVTYGSEGRKYVDGYLENGGKKLSLAYIKDLGYNDSVAKQMVDKMIKSNRTLGMI